MKKYTLIFIVFFLSYGAFMAQGSPPPPPPSSLGGNGPSCWPASPSCNPTEIPINNGLWLLILAGGGYFIFKSREEFTWKW